MLARAPRYDRIIVPHKVESMGGERGEGGEGWQGGVATLFKMSSNGGQPPHPPTQQATTRGWPPSLLSHVACGIQQCV